MTDQYHTVRLGRAERNRRWPAVTIVDCLRFGFDFMAGVRAGWRIDNNGVCLKAVPCSGDGCVYCSGYCDPDSVP